MSLIQGLMGLGLSEDILSLLGWCIEDPEDTDTGYVPPSHTVTASRGTMPLHQHVCYNWLGLYVLLILPFQSGFLRLLGSQWLGFGVFKQWQNLDTLPWMTNAVYCVWGLLFPGKPYFTFLQVVREDHTTAQNHQQYEQNIERWN